MDNLIQMRNYFNSGITKPYAFRKEQLKKLRNGIKKYEKQLHEALYTDLKKNPEECWASETGFVVAEISHTLKHFKRWMQPESVSTNLLNCPSKSFIIQEPLGIVMIIGPWNYPVNIFLTPLIGAIAAGNCAVVKPSEFAPATSAVLKVIIEENFSPEYILLIEGEGAAVIPQLMNNFRFNHVFFTGSASVGKMIYKMAAEKLVPVTLELGGKSPCIIEADANIKIACKRIVLTKFMNAGQVCVAPDYVLVHESKKEALIAEMKKVILRFYGEKPEESYNYGKIINEKQFARLTKYLQQGNILHGGRTDEKQLFIEPTIIDNVSVDSAIMKEEIFGPILPVLTFSSKEEALDIITLNEHPLAFYLFTSGSKNEKYWLNNVPFGGGCINNTSWHLSNYHLPFGGRGSSGSGNYHGRYSFETFSHKKGVMKSPTWFDPAIKYPPFKGKLKLFKMIIK